VSGPNGLKRSPQGWRLYHLAAEFCYVVGFTLWTMWISLTDSTTPANYAFVGFKLIRGCSSPKGRQVAYINLFGLRRCFVSISCGIGMSFAVLD